MKARETRIRGEKTRMRDRTLTIVTDSSTYTYGGSCLGGGGCVSALILGVWPTALVSAFLKYFQDAKPTPGKFALNFNPAG